MKYKNIELKEGNDSEAELLCSIEFKSDFTDDDEIDEVVDKIYELFEDFDDEIYIEVVMDNLIQVRCDDITFDEKGVKILKGIYDILLANFDETIMVGIHIDSEEWFKREDGTTYNEDEATFEEFLEHLEY